MPDAKVDKAQQNKPLASPAWLQATVDDIQAVDIDAPLAGCTDANSRIIGDIYQKAAADLEANKSADQLAARVYRMLAAAMQMHFKPRERNEPFGPMFVMNGRRSAIPSDFRAQVDALAAAAQRTTNPVLKARLADLCWLLDRKRAALGFVALAAYVEIVTKMERRELTYHLLEREGALHHESRNLLQRALWIGQSLGRDKPETHVARDAVRRMRKKSLIEGAQVEILRFAALDLDFGVSDPTEVAADIETVLAQANAENNRDTDVELWRVAARAHTSAKANADRA